MSRDALELKLPVSQRLCLLLDRGNIDWSLLLNIPARVVVFGLFPPSSIRLGNMVSLTGGCSYKSIEAKKGNLTP